MGHISRTRWLLAALLVASTALFAVGVSMERSREDTHAEVRSASEASEPGHADESEASESAEGERIAGVDVESDALLAVAVAVGLALAAAMLTRAGEARAFLLAVAVMALLWAFLDAREVIHQLDESQTAVALVAAVVAALHLAVGVVGLRQSRHPRPGSGRQATELPPRTVTGSLDDLDAPRG